MRLKALVSLRSPNGPVAVLGLVLCISLVGCGTNSAIPIGTAITPDAGAAFLDATKPPIRLGDEWVLMLDVMENRSTQPITIRRVEPLGVGVGSVARVLRVQIAPSSADVGGLSAVSGGLYDWYPPANVERGTKCSVQKVLPVKGYVLAPHHKSYILWFMKAASTGTFRLRGEKVVYDAQGKQFQQALTAGMVGVVERNGTRLHNFSLPGACKGLVRLLP